MSDLWFNIRFGTYHFQMGLIVFRGHGIRHTHQRIETQTGSGLRFISCSGNTTRNLKGIRRQELLTRMPFVFVL